MRIDGDEAVDLGVPDVGALLATSDGLARARTAEGPVRSAHALLLDAVVPTPRKIICVGLNYRSHIEEMGRPLPEHPTVFAKFARALVGPTDDIVLPAVSDRVDWEAELGVVIGAPARHVDERGAQEAIAGYCVVNDVTARDYQRRTREWLQGKTFEATTPIGPWLVTADTPGLPDHGFELSCSVNGRVVQSANTSDLLFGPAGLVAYLSRILTLEPGDLIATGTPGGVGDAADPPTYLQDGDVVETAIAGIGACRNRCVREVLPR